jgi:hypothetical protein
MTEGTLENRQATRPQSLHFMSRKLGRLFRKLNLDRKRKTLFAACLTPRRPSTEIIWGMIENELKCLIHFNLKGSNDVCNF